jgi:hypothetical protein
VIWEDADFGHKLKADVRYQMLDVRRFLVHHQLNASGRLEFCPLLAIASEELSADI